MNNYSKITQMRPLQMSMPCSQDTFETLAALHSYFNECPCRISAYPCVMCKNEHVTSMHRTALQTRIHHYSVSGKPTISCIVLQLPLAPSDKQFKFRLALNFTLVKRSALNAIHRFFNMWYAHTTQTCYLALTHAHLSHTVAELNGKVRKERLDSDSDKSQPHDLHFEFIDVGH